MYYLFSKFYIDCNFQVPKSYSLNNPSEPSFSTLLQGTNLEKGQQQQVLYSNLPVPRQGSYPNF